MTQRHRWRPGALRGLMVGVIGWLVFGAMPGDATPPRGPGGVLYLTYCESCHGAAGKGGGPAAQSLRTAPADLTQLWKRYGTPLDRERLAEYIDGRMLFSHHGSREMPIWGEEFFADVPPDTPGVEDARRHLIQVLVDYLQQLQTEQAT